MPWSERQRLRLVHERKLLETTFPHEHIKWIEPKGKTKVELKVATMRNNIYRLRIYIPEDYPNSVPEMVVCDSPEPMPAWEESHVYHTLNRQDGCVNICHFFFRRWSPKDNKLYQVFKKGRLWLEAYESSLETGRSMDFYLEDMD